ncbi:MAG: FxsA family protein [Nocardioidaceae bacterium]|nr:FxsA family protein [Nocardioidaceae bacterium]
MPLILFALFVGLPIVEIYIIIQVGQQIGAIPTLVLLIVESLLGGWLVKREGRRAWESLRTAVTTGHLPTRELSDAALVLVGGTLLLTPGFVSDVFGFFFVLPFTRPLARRLLAGLVARRAGTRMTRGRGYSPRRGDVHQIHRPGDEPPSGR